jgi:hypothetical protein
VEIVYTLLYSVLVGKVGTTIGLPLIGPSMYLVLFPRHCTEIEIESSVVVLPINKPKEVSAA